MGAASGCIASLSPILETGDASVTQTDTGPHHPDAYILSEHTSSKQNKVSSIVGDKERGKAGKGQRKCRSRGWTREESRVPPKEIRKRKR